MTDEQIEAALVRLRVELFTAAQTLKGEHGKQFWQLIQDVTDIRPIERTEVTP